MSGRHQATAPSSSGPGRLSGCAKTRLDTSTPAASGTPHQGFGTHARTQNHACTLITHGRAQHTKRAYLTQDVKKQNRQTSQEKPTNEQTSKQATAKTKHKTKTKETSDQANKQNDKLRNGSRDWKCCAATVAHVAHAARAAHPLALHAWLRTLVLVQLVADSRNQNHNRQILLTLWWDKPYAPGWPG